MDKFNANIKYFRYNIYKLKLFFYRNTKFNKINLET